MSILEKEISLHKSGDLNYIDNRLNNNGTVAKFETTFKIKHYNEVVEYNLNEWINKLKFETNDPVYSMLKNQNQNQLIALLFKESISIQSKLK